MRLELNEVWVSEGDKQREIQYKSPEKEHACHGLESEEELGVQPAQTRLTKDAEGNAGIH